MMNKPPVSGRVRVRRTLAFLTVVWSIGGLFLAAEAVMRELSWFSASKSLPAKLVLPKQSHAAFLHCQEVVKGLPAPAQGPEIDRERSYLVWRIGYMLGSADASIAAGIAKQAAVEAALRQSLPVTNALGTPPLALPRHGGSAYALAEFSTFLEEDPPCVAAALESRHSPKHAALYKFSAAVGFAGLYRRLAPQLNNVLTPQLRIYGAAAGIPADLYSPLISPPLATRPGPDAERTIQTVVSQIDTYVRRNN